MQHSELWLWSQAAAREQKCVHQAMARKRISLASQAGTHPQASSQILRLRDLDLLESEGVLIVSFGLVRRGAQLLSQPCVCQPFHKLRASLRDLRTIAQLRDGPRVCCELSETETCSRLWQGCGTRGSTQQQLDTGWRTFLTAPEKRMNEQMQVGLNFADCLDPSLKGFSEAQLLDRSVVESVRTAPEKLGGPSQALVSSAMSFSQDPHSEWSLLTSCSWSGTFYSRSATCFNQRRSQHLHSRKACRILSESAR